MLSLKIPGHLAKRLMSTLKAPVLMKAVNDFAHEHHDFAKSRPVDYENDTINSLPLQTKHYLLIEGVQGEVKQDEISLKEARTNLDQAAEHARYGPSVQGVQITYARKLSCSGKDPHEGVVEHDSTEGGVHSAHSDGHQCANTVSLHGCMQTTVPNPYVGKNNYTSVHNMPGAMERQSQRYLSSFRNKMMPQLIRCFSSSSGQWSSVQGTQAGISENDLENDPCPQGIQGDDCVRFRLWMESCKRYNLPNCDDQLQGIQEGRKTLAQVLTEQDELIRRVAANYQSLNTAAKESQGGAAIESAQGIQGGSAQLPEVDSPCPQGIQGDDCVRFKLWLDNCHKFGFGECSEDFQAISSGRKTLAQVFAEQEAVIRQVVELQKQNPEVFNTPPSPPPPHSQPGLGEDSPGGDGNAKISQTHRLKKAVKEYGATVVVFHVCISLVSLGGFYLAVSSGLDMVDLLSRVGLDKYISSTKLAAGASTFVVAYAVHKVFAPARIAITLTSAPFIVRYLRRIGMLKQPPSI